MRRALEALDAPGTLGHVDIEVEVWTDVNTYTATVHDAQGRQWQFSFTPVGWCPKSGRLAATLHAHPDVMWPALAVTEGGLVYPRGSVRSLSG